MLKFSRSDLSLCSREASFFALFRALLFSSRGNEQEKEAIWVPQHEVSHYNATTQCFAAVYDRHLGFDCPFPLYAGIFSSVVYLQQEVPQEVSGEAGRWIRGPARQTGSWDGVDGPSHHNWWQNLWSSNRRHDKTSRWFKRSQPHLKTFLQLVFRRMSSTFFKKNNWTIQEQNYMQNICILCGIFIGCAFTNLSPKKLCSNYTVIRIISFVETCYFSFCHM